MYSARVRVGNWVDRLELESEQREIAARKRAKGELPHQRLLRLKYAFNRPSSAIPTRQACNVDFVKNGQHVQLLAPEIPDPSNRLEASRGCPDDVLPRNPQQWGLLLSATVSPDAIEAGTDRITENCPIGCSPFTQPAARNVFVIKSASAEEGTHLTFGQEFYLELARTNLYLRSETPLIDGLFGPKHHNLLRLSGSRDCYAKWKALHWNRHQRFETDGAPVPPCIRMVIHHVMTGKCLAVESSLEYTSLLGYECAASVHTYGGAKRSSRCIWSFLTHRA